MNRDPHLAPVTGIFAAQVIKPQARTLAEALRALGHDPVLTREPGGSPGAEEIRRLVLEGDPDRWSAETEILLFTAARRDHREKTIRPALARKRRHDQIGGAFQREAQLQPVGNALDPCGDRGDLARWVIGVRLQSEGQSFDKLRTDGVVLIRHFPTSRLC